MVATRRQSGEAAEVTRSTEHPVDDDSALDMTDSEHEHDVDVDVSESEDSDWEHKASRTSNGRAPGKRAKLSNSSGPKKQTQQLKSKRKSLSLLLTMPLDILFETLGLLSPKDLLALTRTSKSLRATLMTRNSITVWKSARESVGCPECPSDFSEPRWAALVFGSNCQNCGAKNVFKVDFGIRRRVCVPCKKNNLVVASKFPTVFPQYDDMVLCFIPHTNVGGWAHGRGSGSKFYWKSDVHESARRLAKLKDDVRNKLPDAKKKLNEFQVERMNLVQEVMEQVEAFDEWYASLSSATADKKVERYNAIIGKFLELGYVDADIRSGIQREKECHQNTLLTDRIWKRIQPILEPLVLEKKRIRLAAAREVLVKSRKRIVDAVYKSYLKTLVPSQWLYHPKANKICEFSPFDQVINLPDDVTVDESSFEEAKCMLPGLISAWSDERKTALKEKIPSQPANTDQTNVESMDLATTVFECDTQACVVDVSPWGYQQGNPLFAWGDAGAHHCTQAHYGFADPGKTLELVLSVTGSAAAANLVALAGLNAARATPADMDQRNLRFFCSECTVKKCMNGRFARTVYTWRAGVAHAMKHNHSKLLTWQVLTIEEATTVKRSETPDPVHHDKCWTCSYCNTYFDNWERRDVVVEHLKSIHHKTGCTEPRDLFYLPHKRRCTIPSSALEVAAPSASASDGPGAATTVRCARCAPPNDRRTFKFTGVVAHLRDKHKINKPTNKDWIVHT